MTQWLAVIKYEFGEILHKSKILLILFFVVITYETILSPMNEVCTQTGFTVGFFEPFVLICSKSTNTIFIPILYMVVISGFPYIKMNYFQIIRIGKNRWLIGEILFIVVSSFAYLIILFIGSVLPILNNISFSAQWSDFMTNVNFSFPEIYIKNPLVFLDASVTAHSTPLSAAVYTFLIMWLNLILIALIMFLGTITGKRIILAMAAVSEIVIGGCSIYFINNVKWLFPITHTQLGAHYHSIFSRVYFPVWGSIVYLIVFNVVVLILCKLFLKKIKAF